jgi:hypothetical protein
MRILILAFGAVVLSTSASFAQEPFFDLMQSVQYRDYDRPQDFYGRRRYYGPRRYYGGPRRYGPPPGYGYYRGRLDCRRVWRRQVTPWGELVVRPRVVCPDGVGYF